MKLDALYEGTYVPDDIRVFIKDEPHKLKKCREGAWRLIMNPSLEDQMVDRILMTTWADHEHHFKVPGKTGWSPLPNGYRYFEGCFPEGKPVLATDCSSFDWTFPEWIPPLLLELRKLCMHSSDSVYELMLERRWDAVLRDAVIRLPDGRRFRQSRYGVMKSGWFRTIAENSSAQLAINALAWVRSHDVPFPPMWSMGDDVIIAWDDDYDVNEFETALATTGIIVKQSSREREFAGFRFGGGKVTPLYPSKHRFLLAHCNPELAEDVATAYTVLYALSEEEAAQQVLPFVTPYSRTNPRAAELWARGGLIHLH